MRTLFSFILLLFLITTAAAQSPSPTPPPSSTPTPEDRPTLNRPGSSNRHQPLPQPPAMALPPEGRGWRYGSGTLTAADSLLPSKLRTSIVAAQELRRRRQCTRTVLAITVADARYLWQPVFPPRSPQFIGGCEQAGRIERADEQIDLVRAFITAEQG